MEKVNINTVKAATPEFQSKKKMITKILLSIQYLVDKTLFDAKEIPSLQSDLALIYETSPRTFAITSTESLSIAEIQCQSADVSTTSFTTYCNLPKKLGRPQKRTLEELTAKANKPNLDRATRLRNKNNIATFKRDAKKKLSRRNDQEQYDVKKKQNEELIQMDTDLTGYDIKLDEIINRLSTV